MYKSFAKVHYFSDSAKYLAKDKDGRDVFLAESNYLLQMAQNDFPHIKFHFTSEF